MSGLRGAGGPPPARVSPVGLVEPVADADAVARLLGRSPAGRCRVVVRRSSGSPAVIENEPWLEDGTPMPTRFWLVDPALCAAVSRVEAAGGVRRAAAAVDPAELAAAHLRHQADRNRWAAVLLAARRTAGLPARGRPAGGVGGTRRGVKCLHAHLAWRLAGGDDPVGRWVVDQLDPAVFDDLVPPLP